MARDFEKRLNGPPIFISADDFLSNLTNRTFLDALTPGRYRSHIVAF
jgi:hypothetical protein